MQGDEEMTEENIADVRKKVQELSAKGIRMLAIDNDLTLISIHTVRLLGSHGFE